MNVLVLEDDELLQDAYERTFRLMGHVAVVVSSPVEAFKKIGMGFIPDIAFTDWDMPGGTGGDFCVEAKERGLELPIVIVSGYPRQGFPGAELASGIMMKPVTGEQLRSTIEQLTT